MAAWSTYYKWTQPLTWGHDDSYGYACMSIKKELVYNGFTEGVDPSKQVIGLQASNAIKEFQKLKGLTADGVVGPNTARVLFKKRALAVENKYDIPNNWVCKLKTLESANDPGAVGSVDPDDHGLVQINLRFHPDFSLQEAIDAELSLNYAGQTLHDRYISIGDWEGAVVSWNTGAYWATRWVRDGKPATGNDYYVRATNYITNVKKQTC